MKKVLFVSMIFIIILVVYLVIFKLYITRYYTFTLLPELPHSFEDNFEIIDLHLFGENKMKDYFFFQYENNVKINKIYFTIQGKRKPLSVDFQLEIERISIKDNEKVIYMETGSIEKSFKNKWKVMGNGRSRERVNVEELGKAESWTTNFRGVTVYNMQIEDKNKGSLNLSAQFGTVLKLKPNNIIEISYSYTNLNNNQILGKIEFQINKVMSKTEIIPQFIVYIMRH